MTDQIAWLENVYFHYCQNSFTSALCSEFTGQEENAFVLQSKQLEYAIRAWSSVALCSTQPAYLHSLLNYYTPHVLYALKTLSALRSSCSRYICLLWF